MATSDQQLRFGADHPQQWDFVDATARYVAFVSGIGAGKTVGGIGRMIRNVEKWNPGHTGYVIAPTVPSLRNVIVPELDKWGILDRCEFNRSENRLEFPNGSTVILESADNDRKIERLRGPSIAWFWMDEAATIARRAWDIMIGRLREGSYLNAFVTTTPKGYNWVHDRFVGAGADVRLIDAVPSTANPHLPDEYSDITDEYEGTFYEQEVLGKFRQPEGMVYDWFGENSIIAPEAVPDAVDETIYGIDFGGSVPTAVACLQRAGEDWYVVGEFYESRVTDDAIVAECQRLYDEFGRGRAYCDHEPRTIEKLSREGVRAEKADKEVSDGIRHVDSLRDRLHVVETCQQSINEFNQYRYKDGQDAPVKEMDHLMDAIRYALYTHDGGKEGYIGTIEF